MMSNLTQTVIFIGHDATRTGAPNSLLKIIGWFKKNTKFKLILLLNRDGPLRSDYEQVVETHVWHDGAHRLRRFSRAQRLYAWWRQTTIIRNILNSRPVCIFNNTGVNGELLRLLQAATSAPIVSRIPELEAFMRRNAIAGSIQQVLACSSHIIAVSEAVRQNLHVRHTIPLDRISIAYGACDVDQVNMCDGELRRKINAKPLDSIVCGCGTMDWRKGYDLFMQTAFTVCIKLKRSDIRFVWIGSAISEQTRVEYDYEIELLGLQGNFFHLGEVEAPSKYFAECDVFFLSSREDPFPLVMLEAARQTLPILCFQGSGGATEFVDSEVGLIVPMLDIDAAAKAILELVDDKEAAQKKGAAAALRSHSFTVERMCEKVHRTVLRVIAKHSGCQIG